MSLIKDFFLNKKLSLSLETSLKQNEADLIMAKKNADLAKVNHEKIQNELVNEKTIIENLKTQVKLMIYFLLLLDTFEDLFSGFSYSLYRTNIKLTNFY